MLTARPITLKAANAFVKDRHRHHKPTVGHKFSIGVHGPDGLCGVVIVGRPVARHSDDGVTAEVLRLCTDGTKNACSFLLARARKAAFAMGYTRIQTFTLLLEGGASLKASGWQLDGVTDGGEWSRPSRSRAAACRAEQKLRWIFNNNPIERQTGGVG